MAGSASVAPTPDSVEEFIAAHDPDGSLARLDPVIAAALPGCARVLWKGILWGGTQQSIIGYGDISQARPRGKPVRWFLIGLARQKDHLSLYVNAAQDGQYLSQVYGQRLGRTRTGSASITFTSAADIDLDVLGELVRHAGGLMEWS